MSFIPLHQLMSHGRAPEAVVSYKGGELLNWEFFSSRVLAHYNALRVHNAQRWLLSSDCAFDFAVQLMALLYAGKVVVIAENNQAATLERLSTEFDAVMQPEIVTDNETSILPVIEPEKTVIDLFTSGSTGKPKRVRKNLVQLEAEITVLETMWGEMMKDATIVATVPHHHIYGLLFRILWPISAGRVFDASVCSHPDILEGRLANLGKTVLVSSPAQLSRLPDLSNLSQLFTRTSLIFSSGGALQNHAARIFQQSVGFEPVEIYGSTETGGIAWRQQCQLAAWQALPGISVGVGKGGALLLSSPFLSTNMPLTLDDAIEQNEDGSFELLGRLDRVVKIEEKRLSLPEIERFLAQHDWVEIAAATPLLASKQSVGVVVALSEEGNVQMQQQGKKTVVKALQQYLRTRYDTVLVPRRWRFMDSLPLNAQGKLVQESIVAQFNLEKAEHAIT